MKIESLKVRDAIDLQPKISQKITHYQYLQLENESIHTPEFYEQTMIHYIKLGDFEGLIRATQTPVTGELGILSSDSQRNMRYLFIVTTTLATRAAMQAGLDAETAYRLSDFYCQQMDCLESADDIEPLTINMLHKICDEVRICSGWESYSPLVRTCCNYISQNLYHRIKLCDLSAYCGMSERRLSQKFKAETGLSPIAYIHKRKIAEAKHLLQHSDLSISQISTTLEYSSQSYFIEIFKNMTGSLPNTYRKQYQLTSSKRDSTESN